MSKGQLIQITGLPRSGTAFMAAFFALNPECISFHELITKSDNYRDEIKYCLNKYKFVVDSSTYGYLPQCVYKDSRKVHIERNISESLKSIKKALKTDIDIDIYNGFEIIINQWKKNNEVMTVDFKNLFNVDVLEIIWLYCFKNNKYFSVEKAKLFIEMNIQMHKPEIILQEKITNRINKQLNLQTCQH